MAELNFGLLNPPGSQSIGNAFVQGMDQAQESRARDLQMQQSMRKGQMDELTYRKALDTESRLNKYYADIAVNGGPKTPEEAEKAMMSSGVAHIQETGAKAQLLRLQNAQTLARFREANPANVAAPMAPAVAPEPKSFAADVADRTAADPFRANMMLGAAAAPADRNNLIANLNSRIDANVALGTAQGYKQAEQLRKQVDDLTRLYPVGNTLMSGQGHIIGTAPPVPRQTNLAADLLIPGPNGTLVPNTALIGVKQSLRPLGTTVNVKLPAIEGEYGKTFAKNTAEEDIKMLGAARNAPKVAATANRVTELLNKPDIFVGPAATVKLNVARALSILGADETESMRNTEKLIAAAGQGTLDAIKDAGLGTGQGFTEKDLMFLTNVAGGKIDFTAENLRNMARLQYRAAELSVKKFTTRRGNMPESAIKGTGIDKETYELPPRIGGPTPESITYLKANPNSKAAFDKRYGDGEAEHTLRMGK